MNSVSENRRDHTHFSAKSNVSAGVLSIVATPIGNLGDITLRALETLKSADIIACEDTRVSKKLLAHYGIATPTTSYHAHSDSTREEALLNRLKNGERVALVTDAGTPLISDPGYELVARARAENIRVETLPGACALIAALSIAGLPATPCYMAGFLPVKGPERTDGLRQLHATRATAILYEAPHRIAKTLADLALLMPNRSAVLAREITKRFEHFYTGSVQELAELTARESLKGEMVLMLAPTVEEQSTDAMVQQMLRDALGRLPPTKAAAEVAKATGRKRDELYALAMSMKDA